jgi:hypothetical protein
MFLGNLQNSAYTRNVDNTRCVAFDISAALVEQTEKSCCHVVDRESIDFVQRGPCIWAVIIEKCIPEGLSVGIFRLLRIVKEIRNRSYDSGTGGVGDLIMSKGTVNGRTCLPGYVISPPFLRLAFWPREYSPDL